MVRFKHIIISYINDFYSKGYESVVNKEIDSKLINLSEIRKNYKYIGN